MSYHDSQHRETFQYVCVFSEECPGHFIFAHSYFNIVLYVVLLLLVCEYSFEVRRVAMQSLVSSE